MSLSHPPEFRTNGSVLRDNLDLDHRYILDVGSGTGKLARYMTRYGARVVGLECGAAQLEKALASKKQADETYVNGVGQDLPFPDGLFHAAIFFNSLHHIPSQHMADALNEAFRVVRPQGTIYCAEPLTSGSGFKLHEPIDDETNVRASASQALHNITNIMESAREITYTTAFYYDDYEDFRRDCIRIKPTRQSLFDQHDSRFRETFDKLGIYEDKGYRFDQPMRVNIFTKPAIT